MRQYRGITIDRIEHSGMYSALVPGYGYVHADTLANMRAMISWAIREAKRIS